MPSSCSVGSPALTAKERVTVKSVCGSRFKSRLRFGEVVVDLPADVKLVPVLIVPSVSPSYETCSSASGPGAYDMSLNVHC